jgi:DNA-binding FadR family transcriptional regulator
MASSKAGARSAEGAGRGAGLGRSGQRGLASLAHVARVRAADDVFEQLAGAIVRGEIEPGEAIPPERVLAEQFGVSRLIVRQALHRLEEMQLVRVRQGGASIALDPARASDIRLIGLLYRMELAPAQSAAVERDMVEKQYLQGLSLIDVASRRASDDERAGILEMANGFDEASATEADLARFEQRFWRAVAAAGKNGIYVREVDWWYEHVPEPPRTPAADAPIATRIGFYRELARRLAEREQPTAYYLAATAPALDALFGSGA